MLVSVYFSDMKIGIISDTHNKLAGIDAAFTSFSRHDIGLILHCGDWTRPETAAYFASAASDYTIPVKGVLGNNDTETRAFVAMTKNSEFELYEGVLRLEVGGRSIAVYHGHHTPTLRTLLTEEADLVCLGHSHKPRYDRLDNKIILNPGSTAFAIPRSKTWLASVAIYDTDIHEAVFEYFALE